MLEFDESEYAYSDFTDDQLRQIGALCGVSTVRKLLITKPIPVSAPAEVNKRRCTTRSWKWPMLFGKKVSR